LPQWARLGWAGLMWAVGKEAAFLHAGPLPTCCPPTALQRPDGTPEKVLIGYLRVRVNRRAYILLKLVCYIYSRSCKFQSLKAS